MLRLLRTKRRRLEGARAADISQAGDKVRSSAAAWWPRAAALGGPRRQSSLDAALASITPTPFLCSTSASRGGRLPLGADGGGMRGALIVILFASTNSKPGRQVISAAGGGACRGGTGGFGDAQSASLLRLVQELRLCMDAEADGGLRAALSVTPDSIRAGVLGTVQWRVATALEMRGALLWTCGSTHPPLWLEAVLRLGCGVCERCANFLRFKARDGRVETGDGGNDVAQYCTTAHVRFSALLLSFSLWRRFVLRFYVAAAHVALLLWRGTTTEPAEAEGDGTGGEKFPPPGLLQCAANA